MSPRSIRPHGRAPVGDPEVVDAEQVLPADIEHLRRVGSNQHDALHHYWRLLYGRRWLLLAAAVLGLAVSAAYTLRQPKLYTAQSTVEFKQALPPGKQFEKSETSVSIPPAVATRLLTTKLLAARAIRILYPERVAATAAAPPADTTKTPAEPSGLAAAWQAVTARVAATLNVASSREPSSDTARPDVDGSDLAATLSLEAPTHWEGVSLGEIGGYYGHIAISPVRGTSLVDIVVSHPNPPQAARIANAHAQAFIDMDSETRAASLNDAHTLVRQQLDDVRKQLQEARGKLNDFQWEHGILKIDDATTLTRRSLEQLNRLLTEAQGQRIVAEASYRNAAAMSADDVARTLPNGTLDSIRNEISGLRARYAANQKEFGPNHPDMVTLRAKIASLEARLREVGDQARAQLRAALEAAQTKEQELQTNFQRLSSQANEEDRGLVQMLVLQREVESNQQLYNTLLGQAKEADLLTNGFRWSGVKLIDRAVVPGAPSSPNVPRNLTMGLFLALMLGMTGAILLDRLDTRIHTPEDVLEWLHLPSLGVIPDFRRVLQVRGYGRAALDTPAPTNGNGNGNGHGRQVVTVTNPGSVISEAYRTIRTNLLFSSPGNPPKTVLVTSSQASEGKTVTTINLAVSLAMGGSNVCVIDADMRHPSCHEPLKVPGEPGLSTVLTGQCELGDAVVRSPMLNGKNGDRSRFGLFVLPAGPIPPNPAELVGSRVMSDVLATLAEKFDFVLVDSPPILPVTDSVVMATKTDGVLIVVKSSEWGRDVVGKALSHLDSVRAHVLGVVLNSVDVKRGGSSYYYYRHYHGGYYGYYGNTKQQA